MRWDLCADGMPIEFRGAVDATIDWGQSVKAVWVVVADIGHGGIIRTDALRWWGTSLNVGSGGAQLDMDATINITASAAWSDTDGLCSETLVDK